MKKIWKILGAAALVAGLTPYRVERDEASGETTYRALLWKATIQPHPEREEMRQATLRLGFHSPTDHTMEEARMFADELLYASGTEEPAAAEPKADTESNLA